MTPDLDTLLEGTPLGGQREAIIQAALREASAEAFDIESQRRFEGIEAQPVDTLAEVVAYLRQQAEACLALTLTADGESKALLKGAYLARLDDADAIEAGKHREGR